MLWWLAATACLAAFQDARPAGARGVLPVVIYTHGGGWVLGDKQTHDRLVRELAVGAGAVIVFVDYDRSPEARFPTAIEQAYAVAKYVSEHGEEFGADPDTGGMRYRTTELFLERLGLSGLEELPPIAPLLPEVDSIDDV